MWLGVLGLMLLIAAVSWQVFGRYVLNNTPTWAESLSLLLVLYVTMFGVAVGVRNSGHIGLESFLVLAPLRPICRGWEPGVTCHCWRQF